MKRFFYYCVIVFLFGVIIGYLFLGKLAKEDKVGKDDNVINPQNLLKSENVISDNTTVSVESQEEKISPQAVVIINKHYNDCNHTITNVIDVPVDMVNLTEERLKKEFPDWEIIDFSNKQVSLYKEFDGVCNEHYCIRENNGIVTVYYMDENNNEKLYEITDINIEYLTDGDKLRLKDGINIYGKNELNALLEDFE